MWYISSWWPAGRPEFCVYRWGPRQPDIQIGLRNLQINYWRYERGCTKRTIGWGHTVIERIGRFEFKHEWVKHDETLWNSFSAETSYLQHSATFGVALRCSKLFRVVFRWHGQTATYGTEMNDFFHASNPLSHKFPYNYKYQFTSIHCTHMQKWCLCIVHFHMILADGHAACAHCVCCKCARNLPAKFLWETAWKIWRNLAQFYVWSWVLTCPCW